MRVRRRYIVFSMQHVIRITILTIGDRGLVCDHNDGCYVIMAPSLKSMLLVTISTCVGV